jgi:hypothetical protein
VVFPKVDKPKSAASFDGLRAYFFRHSDGLPFGGNDLGNGIRPTSCDARWGINQTSSQIDCLAHIQVSLDPFRVATHPAIICADHIHTAVVVL